MTWTITMNLNECKFSRTQSTFSTLKLQRETLYSQSNYRVFSFPQEQKDCTQAFLLEITKYSDKNHIQSDFN